MDKAAIAQKLRETRKSKGMTMTRLANLVGITHAGYSRIENGHNKPLRHTLKAIAAVLGLDPATLEPLAPAHPVYDFARWVEKHIPPALWEANWLKIIKKVVSCVYPESPPPMETNEENYGNVAGLSPEEPDDSAVR